MKKTVIGIYEEEIFLVEGNDINNVHRGIDGKPVFCVLRPVSKEQLEDYRDDDEIREEVREQADNFIKENCGYEVGTWEASGCYEPAYRREFNGFDFVFPTPEAQAFAEAYTKERNA